MDKAGHVAVAPAPLACLSARGSLAVLAAALGPENVLT